MVPLNLSSKMIPHNLLSLYKLNYVCYNVYFFCLALTVMCVIFFVVPILLVGINEIWSLLYNYGQITALRHRGLYPTNGRIPVPTPEL